MSAPRVVAVARDFLDDTSEGWSERVASGWQGYVLQMLGHGAGSACVRAVRLRLANGQLVVVRPRIIEMGEAA